jgi:hypothetical protein
MRVRVFDAIFFRAVILLVFAALMAVPAGLRAQQGTSPLNPPPIPRIPGNNPSGSDNGEDSVSRRMQAQLAVTRNNQRQEQLVSDTAKLLELATQLKEEVDKSNKNTLSLSVVKKAEEIEKLAKAVKEKMRDAQ